jgi:hypothetical protein
MPPVTVLTNHKGLEYWKDSCTFHCLHAERHLKLASYNFNIPYRPGKQSEKPDALSRPADQAQGEPEPQILLPEALFYGFAAELSGPLLSRIKDALSDDPSLDVELSVVAASSSLALSVAMKFKHYRMHEGLLLYRGRIVVPDEPGLKQKLTHISMTLLRLVIRDAREPSSYFCVTTTNL